MNKIVAILIIIFSSFSSYASEQDLYYNLHQAYTALEMMVGGKCKQGRNIAYPYLIAGNKILGKLTLTNKQLKSDFTPSLRNLWTVWKKEKIEMFDVELVRADVQTMADLKKLIHYKKRWHNEVNSKCL